MRQVALTSHRVLLARRIHVNAAGNENRLHVLDKGGGLAPLCATNNSAKLPFSRRRAEGDIGAGKGSWFASRVYMNAVVACHIRWRIEVITMRQRLHCPSSETTWHLFPAVCIPLVSGGEHTAVSLPRCVTPAFTYTRRDYNPSRLYPPLFASTRFTFL